MIRASSFGIAMARRPWLLTLVIALALLPPTHAQAAPGDVKRTIPAGCRYPTGLATDGTSFYVADWREGQIHCLSVADATPVACIPAPTLKPAGLSFGGGRLFVSDDHTGWVYVVNPQTGFVERSFEAPGTAPTGLAYAADGLFILERKSHQISKVMPDDGTIIGFIPAPNDTCSGLCYDGSYLWVSDRIKNELYLVNPDDGTVLGILDAPGPYAAGVAWLDGYLWNVDFQTRQIYQIATREPPGYRLYDPREARVEFLWALRNYGPGELRNVEFAVAVPQAAPGLELLSEVQFASPPAKNVSDRWGQPCAIFEFDAIPAGEQRTLGYTVEARVQAQRFLIYPDMVAALSDIPDDIRKVYTIDGPRYRIDSPFIQETVKRIVSDEKKPYWIARKVFNYLIDKLEYEMVGGWDVPEAVLKRGKGSCSEYTFAFIALCRAAGLPARYVGSVVVRGDDASVDDAFHRWAEVYLPGYGWVPVDASRGDAKSPADQARAIGEVSNRFLITTHGGGRSEYLEWDYNSFARYQATAYCKVDEERLAFWEPLKPATTQPASSQPAPVESSRPGECRVK